MVIFKSPLQDKPQQNPSAREHGFTIAGILWQHSRMLLILLKDASLCAIPWSIRLAAEGRATTVPEEDEGNAPIAIERVCACGG